MLCDLPTGDIAQLAPAVMINLLGDLWSPREPAWERLLEHPGLKLHLYGKQEARPGRKMGHYTCLARKLDTALAIAKEAKHLLTKRLSA